MVTAFVALGSNQGDRLTNLSVAVDMLAHLPETHVSDVSHAYESAPAYDLDQPNFLNAVASVETGLEADALLAFLLDIEDRMGRVRNAPNGPRVIDLDLLLFGDEERASDTLTLPHPGLKERDFVVTPLLEIAPRTKLPNGTMLRRSEATEGIVLRDYGKVPDAGESHNMPIEDVPWVVVAASEWARDAVSGFDASLQLYKQVLETEHIPFSFEPFEPGVDMDPFGLPLSFKLLVPEAYAEKAMALIAEVEAAEPQFPPGYEE